jgi:OOP family OmpA-OmpF porin
MRILIVAALATTVFASPALARDGSGYVGFEGGAIWAQDARLRATAVTPVGTFNDVVRVDYRRPGLDFDLIGGYDFGVVRAEAELGYKRASVRRVDGLAVPGTVAVAGDGNTGVTSVMGNLLLDFGDNDGLSVYAGGGAGWARVKHNSIARQSLPAFLDGKDSGLAYQAIAGIRYAITPQLDIGLKGRYFRTSNLRLGNALGATAAYRDFRSKFRSTSLLASIIYNFAEPAAPPPPPPPPPPIPMAPPAPPATQTCPDGSVVLATDVCPVQPAAPPPPPPAPERG